MLSSSDNPIEHLLEEHVLSLFPLPSGNITWYGDSELNTQSYVYYFSINNFNYLLVKQAHHGVGDSTFVDSIVGNAVAPHQEVAPILPKEGARIYVNISKGNDDLASKCAGDFSLFRIFN